jgi:O-antigen/teichoic acid export membrane protein
LRNILRLSLGDFLAKTLNFLAFVYLARVLGVETFGVLEFAGALLTWFLLLADGGLELWATREVARSQDLRALAGRVLPLRLLVATGALLVLLGVLPLLSAAENHHGLLRALLALYGLSLFAQALTLKWAFLGKEEMARVGTGLVIGQMAFALLIFAVVRDAGWVVWVPVLRFLSDMAMAAFFARRFRQAQGTLRLPLTLRGAGALLRPAATLGMSQALALLNYNFDSVLLGFLRGVREVGLYSAAYKPVTIALAAPLTYFIGLFPALARTHAEGPEAFRALVARSFRLCAIFAVPLGVGSTLLAAPVIALLFGPAYADSVEPLQVLIWSAVFVILRGSYRHALNAAGHPSLDLRCAVVSASLNLGLNIALIPRYGMLGAASATVFADVVWFLLAVFYFERGVMRLSPWPFFARPAVAAVAMAAFLWYAQGIWWVARAGLAAAVYFAALLALKEPELRAALSRRRTSQAS